MSIIASTYNTGTGLSVSVAETTLPPVVDDLTVNGNLIVIETTVLNGQTTINNNLNITGTTTSNNAVVNNNLIINNGVGQNSGALLKLPLNNGIDGQVLTILNDAVTPITTSWQTPVNDYVQFNTTTNKLSKVDFSGTAEISNLVLGTSIGLSTPQKFILPLNTSTAPLNSVLSLTNLTSKKTSWEPLPVPITDYTNYNNTNKTLISNVSGTPTIISDIQLTTTGQTGQKFQLPSNTSTALNNSILSINSITKNTTWISDYLDYNSTTTAIENNVTGSSVAITDLQLTTIGQSGQKFQLPFNTSSTTAGSYYLTINNTTKNSFWSVPFANVSYDGSSYVLSSEDPSAGILPITNIQMTTIGRLNQKFNLPTNTSTALNGSLLSIDSASKNTTWQSDYLKYNTTTTQLTNNVTGSAVAITDLVMSNSIGSSIAQKFTLPTNSSTAPAGNVLGILFASATNPSTAWINVASTILSSINSTPISCPSGSQVTLAQSPIALTFGKYFITYEIEIQMATTTRAFSYMGYGITSSTVANALITTNKVGLCVGNPIPFTAPVFVSPRVFKLQGSGYVDIASTQTLYLLIYLVYTGTTTTAFGSMYITKIY